ncbi:hypothetical protein BC943DRAFT_105716 [Umbelopsis sp. AD052]|nr:hypothetical protein BC943DRAFT_105716 [Umbelopsis sp. AD052]
MTATAINANQTTAILENDTTDAQSSVTPQEIGMMFVHEYYNFLHDDPQKLHLFYNKNSSYLHGEEGDLNVKLVSGNQHIRKAITDLNLNNCMVMVSSVDSQSSANNGIIVQVLGEMSNQGTEARKFAQTFFLAEQPKGYYVLNDIFRFLREDIDYEEGFTEEEVAPAAVEEKAAEPEQPAVSSDDAQTAAVEATQVAEAKPEEESAVVPEVKETPAVAKTEETKEKPVEQAANGVASEGSAKEQQQQQQRPKKSKADGDKQKQKQHASAAKSNAPKTWANLAANDSEKWGTQVAEAKGPVASVPVNPPKQSPQPQQQQLQNKPTKTENISIFVKNVQQTMTEEQLKEAFGKFGAIKTLTVVHPKNCAFLDFNNAESAHKALSQQKITIGSAIVLAEERRPQGGRGAQFEGRRQNGEGRGGFENRRGGMHRTASDKQAGQQADGQQSERGNRRGNAGRGGDRKGNNTNKSQPNAQANSPASK